MAGMKVLDETLMTSGVDGAATFEMNGKKYSAGIFTKFEGKVAFNNTQKKVLGRRTEVTLTNGTKGTWSATAYYSTDIYRKAVVAYMNGTGAYPVMTVTTTNKNESLGTHTVIYRNCKLDEVILSKIDVDSDVLTEDLKGTFDGVSMPSTFNNNAVPEI